MTAPDPVILPGQPAEGGEPVFHEPWQARAFAMAVQLNAAGLLAWDDWAQRLGAALAAQGPLADPDPGAQADTYYRAWMAALEGLMAEQGLADAAGIDSAAATWERAARATPHGQPILFETGLADPAHM